MILERKCSVNRFLDNRIGIRFKLLKSTGLDSDDIATIDGDFEMCIFTFSLQS